MGMKEGELPMKYLGVPLSSRKLFKEDYSLLINKICRKIDSWQAMHLSMGGRAQLIRTSIFGVQNFWCSIFPLPKYVIAEVEKRIRTFMWKGTSEFPYHAKVAWDTLCLPFGEGGLGFKDMLKSVSLWQHKKKDKDPWYWKKLLPVRHLICDRYFIVVGNGRLISFWFDNWGSFASVWTLLVLFRCLV
ncbi:reverse transcriptase [Lithospermum erythrorhizon]|uniref:Reverse transcriptase n=1 Tax=Lithospermum erythrorhizon TaxID=34254 RepID=A0AAV3RVA4_LITER